MKLRRIKWLVQDPSASKRHSWDLNPGLLALNANPLVCVIYGRVIHKLQKE